MLAGKRLSRARKGTIRTGDTHDMPYPPKETPLPARRSGANTMGREPRRGWGLGFRSSPGAHDRVVIRPVTCFDGAITCGDVAYKFGFLGRIVPFLVQIRRLPGRMAQAA